MKNDEENFIDDFKYNYNNINPKIESDLLFFLSTNETLYQRLLIPFF